MANLADLILRGGAQQAAFTQNRYDILGNAVAGLGAGIGDYVQQKHDAKAMSARTQAWVDFVENWDGDPQSALVGSTRIWGPQDGDRKAQALLATGKVKSGKGTPEDIKRIADGLKDEPDEVWQRWWPQLREMGQAVYPEAPLSEQFNPEEKDFILKMFGSKPETPKPEKVTRREGDREITEWVVPTPGMRIESDVEAKPDSRSLEVRYADAIARGDQAEADRLRQAAASMAASTRAPQAPGEPKGPTFRDVGGLPHIVNPDGTLTPATGPGGVALVNPAKDPDALKPLSGDAAQRMGYSGNAIKLGPEIRKAFGEGEGLMGQVAGRARYVGAVTGLDTGLTRKIDDFLDAAVRGRSGATTNPAELKEKKAQVYSLIDAFLRSGDTEGAIAAVKRIEQEMATVQDSIDPSGEYRKLYAKRPQDRRFKVEVVGE